MTQPNWIVAVLVVAAMAVATLTNVVAIYRIDAARAKISNIFCIENDR